MKKLLIYLIFCITTVFASNLNIEAYRNDILMMEYHIANVKSWSWMTNQQGHKFIRVYLNNNDLIDLPLNDYEVKIKK